MPVAIFDMDGVLYRGSLILPYAHETLARLRSAGWGVYFVTNNSTRTRADYVTRLATLGLGGDIDHVVNSAYATAQHLARRDRPPRDVLVIGADGLRQELRSMGLRVRAAADLPGLHPPPPAAADGADPGAMTEYLTHLDDLPPVADAVVVGLDLHLTYAKLAEAQRCILAGAEFVCTNRDHAYPVEGRLLPGAGATVAALEISTGRTALCIGKPEPYLFAETIHRAVSDGPVVVIGDSPEYDMVAAHRVGATGVLILTGLADASAAAGAKGEAKPDRVIRTLDELFALPEFAGA